MQILFTLWLAVSIMGSLMMILDKHNAKKQKKRISEKTLILTACSGASLFMWITMYLIHHKTKHIQFSLGLPLISAVHLIILFMILN